MSYTIEYDNTVWYPVPAEFPTETWASPDDWKNEFVAMFQRDLGEIPPDGVLALDEFADWALVNRPVRVSESLIFCPRITPVLGIANILVTAVHDDETPDLAEIASSDSRAQLPPTLEEITTENLGAGMRAATVIDASDNESAAGAFTYAFDRLEHLVVVGATADRVSDATVMLPFLERLVEGIRVEAE